MNALSFLHLFNSEQVTDTDWQAIYQWTDYFRTQIEGGERQASFPKTRLALRDLARGRILANLFYEPSTRTRFSFASAMHHLGGEVLNLDGGETSSNAKGETLEDTGRIMAGYADIIVFRHAEIGSVLRLAQHVDKPVINAGDGSNQHPTQTLIDLYHILSHKRRLEGLNICFYGDILYSRTVLPLLRVLSRYGNRIYLVAPEGLRPTSESLKDVQDYEIVEDITTIIDKLDVLYVTRLQRERIDNASVQSLANFYIVDQELVQLASQDLIIMHPLPRVGEISPAIDELPQATYFQQARNGLYVRIALLALMLGVAD